MVNTDLSSSLRHSLLCTSVGLAIVVSMIFISVALNLSRDLGESLELEHSSYLFSQLTTHVKDIYHKDNKGVLNEQVQKDLLAHLDKDVIGAEIWLDDKHVKLKSYPFYTQNDDIVNAIETKASNKGFFEVENTRLFWFYGHYPQDKISVLLIRKTNALDKAISYVTNRLFIAAFITFWLTIWVALFLSALVTKRFEESNERLKYLATHDMLSGLPNRTYLYQHAQSYLKSANRRNKRQQDTLLAIYLIDLDKFKDINDTMGHLVGDELLKTVSNRLLSLKDEDLHVVRFGGDEFVIWCDNLSESKSIALAEHIIAKCRQPIRVNNYIFEISVSVGVAYYPEHGLHLDDLLKNADIAMYQAKKHRLGFQVFQQDLFIRSEFRVNLRGQLSIALEQMQFILYYQPKVQLPHGKIVGVEALVRWQHPREGLLTPNMFIDIIEQSMFVHEFTRYVLSQAIMQCRLWLDKGIELSVAVNISPFNLMDPELVSYLSTQLSLHQVPAKYIEIELTENASMVNIEKTQEVFSQLKNLGVKLSIDDFGTGMSSLAYIKQLDVDYIKIDRSFIIDVVKDKKDEAIIVSLLVLCQKLNKLIIAEGVETIEQSEKLTRLGCNLAQGYLYSKPLPVEEVTKLLAKRIITLDSKEYR